MEALRAVKPIVTLESSYDRRSYETSLPNKSRNGTSSRNHSNQDEEEETSSMAQNDHCDDYPMEDDGSLSTSKPRDSIAAGVKRDQKGNYFIKF